MNPNLTDMYMYRCTKFETSEKESIKVVKHYEIHLKLIQYYKSTILQLKSGGKTLCHKTAMISEHS